MQQKAISRSKCAKSYKANKQHKLPARNTIRNCVPATSVVSTTLLTLTTAN